MKLKYKNQELKKRQGFTLVEMVLVVTILGVLSGTAFMKFGGIQEKAKENADYITVANIVTAVNLGINDNIIKESDNNDKIWSSLIDRKYISSIPKPQSVEGKFDIAFKEKGLTITAGEKQFYPDKKINTETTPEPDPEE